MHGQQNKKKKKNYEFPSKIYATNNDSIHIPQALFIRLL